jgi:hypothetical protein
MCRFASVERSGPDDGAGVVLYKGKYTGLYWERSRKIWADLGEYQSSLKMSFWDCTFGRFGRHGLAGGDEFRVARKDPPRLGRVDGGSGQRRWQLGLRQSAGLKLLHGLATLLAGAGTCRHPQGARFKRRRLEVPRRQSGDSSHETRGMEKRWRSQGSQGGGRG